MVIFLLSVILRHAVDMLPRVHQDEGIQLFPHVQIALDIVIQTEGPDDIVFLIMNKKVEDRRVWPLTLFP